MAKEMQIIKTPYKKDTYTNDQIMEFAKCADPITGPEYFMDNFFYIQHPTKGSIQYHPFEYQKKLIYTYHNYRSSISLMPRQTGKSTSAAGYLLWYAMFVPDSTILIAAHKYTGAQEIMQRIRYAYENCPDFIRAGVTEYNKGSLTFENGSRIVSQTTTENTGRGMSITLLYMDEFGFVRPSIASEFWTSITPTLSTGGKCIITSTPNSDEDQFAQIWRDANKCVDEFGNETDVGINKFKAYRAHWTEHPERGPEYEKEMRAKLGDEKFAREILCEFVSADETLISPTFLPTMVSQQPLRKQGQVRWYSEIDKDSTYCVSLDPSLGTGGDYAAIQVVELPSMRQVAEWQHNKTPIQMQIKLLREITQTIFDVTKTDNTIYYSVENNTLGEAALVSISEIGEENIHGIFLSEPGKGGRGRKGFTTSNKSKLAACAKLKQWIESSKLKISSKNLISELKNFIASGAGYAAKIGETDDLVMSMLLACRMIQVIQTFDSKLDMELRENAEFVPPLPFIMF